jgi:hypothetical protein
VKKIVTKNLSQAAWSGNKCDSQVFIVPNGYRSAGQSVKYRPKDVSEKGQQIWLKLPAPERLPSGWEERHDPVKGDGGYSWVNTHNPKNVVEVRPTRTAVRPRVRDGVQSITLSGAGFTRANGTYRRGNTQKGGRAVYNHESDGAMKIQFSTQSSIWMVDVVDAGAPYKIDSTSNTFPENGTWVSYQSNGAHPAPQMVT